MTASATLRAAIDWSYDLLSKTERILLCRLGVFSGGFSLQAAEAVCAGGDIHSDQVSDLMGSLVWKSLVIATTHQEGSRYRLLETIRAYAEEKLPELGASEVVRARHCQWYAEQSEEVAPHLVQAQARTWLRRLDQELDNFRAALGWAIESERQVEASKLVVGLWRYWHMRGDIEEGRRWAAEALAIAGADSVTRAKTLEAAGGLAYWAGAMEDARELYEECLSLFRASGSEEDIANALYNASFAYGFGGMTEAALEYAEEALRIYQGLGDKTGVAKSRWGWGASATAGGRDEEARVAFEEALSIYDHLDDTFMLAWVHRMLGMVLLRLKAPNAARPHLDAGIRLFDAAGDVSGIILHIRDYAQMALDDGDSERALILVGALSALQETTGLDLVEAFSEHLEGLEIASKDLGARRTEELLERGCRMSRAEMIRYAQS